MFKLFIFYLLYHIKKTGLYHIQKIKSLAKIEDGLLLHKKSLVGGGASIT